RLFDQSARREVESGIRDRQGTCRSRTSRIPGTAQMELADAAEHYQRGVELVKLAQAARAARAVDRGEA
ncbi:hypothetical protein, partial [Escherichia coli]|uniref:hypothetical protein n=1 Tax=Escherichia coli TaxID=562 RepID=UPI001A7E9B1C